MAKFLPLLTLDRIRDGFVGAVIEADRRSLQALRSLGLTDRQAGGLLALWLGEQAEAWAQAIRVKFGDDQLAPVLAEARELMAGHPAGEQGKGPST